MGIRMVEQYIEKPKTIEAAQWNVEDLDQIVEWLDGHSVGVAVTISGDLDLQTMDGYVVVRQGDWVVKDSRGVFKAMTEGVFETLYEIGEV